MSDGERVIFYLIGECLAAPEDGVIVIDEPEIHLHKAIQSRLWDAIEAERTDCQFVYLTHDLDFAATRTTAKKIWLRSYDGQFWDWHEVPQGLRMPEEVLLTVLGSRKSILFVEGNAGSSDVSLYSLIYSDFTVVPHGSCNSVISSTRAFSGLKHLHHLNCVGIIDKDYRSDEEVEQLEESNIFAIGVSEVENLLLTEEVLVTFERANYFGHESRVPQVKETVF